MTFASCAKVAAGDAATLAAANTYTDTTVASGDAATLAASKTYTDTTVASGDAATLAASKTYTDTTVAAGDAATLAASKTYTDTTVAAGDAATLAASKAYTDAAAPVNATDTVPGVVQLNQGGTAGDDTNDTAALTAAGFNTLTSSPSGTNALQTAVAALVVARIEAEPLKQEAVATAIVDELRVKDIAFTGDVTLEGVMTGLGGGSVSTNTRYGVDALKANTTGAQNTATGLDALKANTTGSQNTATGLGALRSNTTGNYNTATGMGALQANTTGSQNTASGYTAFLSNTTGSYNTATGLGALRSNTTGDYNTATGLGALQANTTGSQNTASGYTALQLNTTGNYNTATGFDALRANTTGSQNTASGYYALRSNTTGSQNTAVGRSALYLSEVFNNTSGVGYNSNVTADNQVQLGDATTTTFVYGTVQNRSDLRDKADVRPTVLGLQFINALRPVDYKWDMREDYRPERPAPLEQDATEEQAAAHKQAMAVWIEACKQDNITRDGSKKRNRYHHGLIAQEVQATIAASGVDFGGFQHHKLSGGHDVMSIGYDELIAPLIKAVQELSAKVAALEAAQ